MTPGAGGPGYSVPGIGTAWKYQQTDAPLAAMPSGTQGFNVGHDALMHAARARLGFQGDPTLMSGLTSAASGRTQFDNSELFKSLGRLDNQMLNEQVEALHGSAGSLGERFGTAMNQNEAMMRGNFMNQASARNAQIAQQSFEAAQARAMQGLGMLQGQNQFGNQFGLNALQAQMAAAGTLGSQGLQSQGMGLQNNQFNAGQQMQNQQFAAPQGNSSNNMMMQALGMGNQMQQQQFGNNAQMLGLLAGIPVAQAQAPSALPGAIGELGQTAAMWPFLSGLLGGGGQQSNWSNFMPWGS